MIRAKQSLNMSPVRSKRTPVHHYIANDWIVFSDILPVSAQSDVFTYQGVLAGKLTGNARECFAKAWRGSSTSKRTNGQCVYTCSELKASTPIPSRTLTPNTVETETSSTEYDTPTPYMSLRMRTCIHTSYSTVCDAANDFTIIVVHIICPTRSQISFIMKPYTEVSTQTKPSYTEEHASSNRDTTPSYTLEPNPYTHPLPDHARLQTHGNSLCIQIGAEQMSVLRRAYSLCKRRCTELIKLLNPIPLVLRYGKSLI